MNNGQSEQELVALKDEMILILAQPQIDADRMLEIANQLAKSVPDRARFSVDASLINRLGRELVTRKEIAVAELIKNAYDADATQVTVTFQNTEIAGGTLTIEDNGHGMTYDQLITNFMRLAATEKIHQPYSPKYKRLRAGKKGIGRFATQRLGRKLKIFTQYAQENSKLELEIDWEKFETDKELSLISQRVREVRGKGFVGTTLVIDNLEDAWMDSDIKQVYQYISELLQPFPLSQSRSELKNVGFDVKIYKEGNNQKEEIASVEKLIYEHALAEIRGEVDKQGNGTLTYKCERYGINVIDEPFGTQNKQGNIVAYQSLQNIRFIAYYYISDEMTSGQKRLLQGMLREKGGIRVYRNGFRVLPYGEPKNDWLYLDQRSARRLILVPFKNQNFLGFVEIFDVKGDILEETSSREGLLENQAFEELRKFIGDALEKVVIHVGQERGRKVKPTKPNLPPTPPIERIGVALEKLDRSLDAITVESKNENLPKDIQKTLNQITEIAQQTTKTTKELILEHKETLRSTLEEIEMLRILASLGLAIGEFTHETKTLFPSLKADVNNILSTQSLDEISIIATRMKQNIETLSDYLAYFDKSIAANVRRDARPLDVSEILYSFWRIINSSARLRGITALEPEVRGFNLLTAPMHPSEWSSILFNLYTNAYKAINRLGKPEGKILIRGGKEDNQIFVEFADNGDGIPEKNRNRIFDAFFTTSQIPDPLDDPMEGMQGSGLGLKIVKDIVETRNGKIFLVGAPRNYVTCFRIEIPAATEKEKKDYGY